MPYDFCTRFTAKIRRLGHPRRHAERHRIVAKVDALMALCDSLEARLNVRTGVQGKCRERL